MFIHSFIFYTASSIVGHGGAGAYLQQSTGERPCTHSFTPKGNLERPINLTVMYFGLWEEAGVPGENPHMHRENMQTLCRKTPGRELNPGSSCGKATVLPIAPPCSPSIIVMYLNVSESQTLLKLQLSYLESTCLKRAHYAAGKLVLAHMNFLFALRSRTFQRSLEKLT
ncbi:hypothetical protein XENOCAPTIV_024824 [Xenoophorus captivus]|uniref:Uncharacterized protein n=1 Tax=Xenoophorus captivus TaxID=1517983 RepID=A0ABV0RIU8_9TELE